MTAATAIERATAASPSARLVTLCRVDEIPPRGSRVVRVDGGALALFRTAEGEVFALADRCPHAGGPLSQGIVHGRSVTCPLHNWVISLETGKALGADKGQVPTIPLSVADGVVALDPADLPQGRACRRLQAQRDPPP